MAEKRMFAKTIIDSDAFLDMPTTSQLLYFHLSMRADDDGFINKPKSIMRMVGASDDDLKILFMKKFVIPFESGIVVIKHWRINNYIRQDMYHKTPYQDEFEQLMFDENGAYTLRTCNETVTNSLRNSNELTTQYRLDQKRIDKTRIEKHKYGQYKNVLLSDDEMESLKKEFPDYQERIERVSAYCASTGKSYKNYLATIRNWARKEAPKKEETKPKKLIKKKKLTKEEKKEQERLQTLMDNIDNYTGDGMGQKEVK